MVHNCISYNLCKSLSAKKVFYFSCNFFCIQCFHSFKEHAKTKCHNWPSILTTLVEQYLDTSIAKSINYIFATDEGKWENIEHKGNTF